MNLVKRLMKKRLIQVIVILCIVLGAGALWLQHWSNEPATTTIHIADNNQVVDKTPAYQPIKSKLFASEVPYGWLIRTNTDTTSLTQMVGFPGGSSINHGQVAVTVDMLTAGGITAVPDYNVRVQDKTNYQKQTTDLPGVSATFIDLNNGPGYTVFMIHGGRYAIVTVSQFATPNEAHSLLSHVVTSWKWND
jgi:hypothetical protein